MGVDGGLVGASTDTLRSTHASGLLAAVVVKLVGGHALHGLAKTGVDFRRGHASKRVRSGGPVVGGLCRCVLSVALESSVRRSGASREDLCAELGDGVVASEDTRLVLWIM